MPNTKVRIPNVGEQYVCYFCEEEIEFGPPMKSGPSVFLDEFGSVRSQWIHAFSGNVRCHSVATPSNLELF